MYCPIPQFLICRYQGGFGLMQSSSSRYRPLSSSHPLSIFAFKLTLNRSGIPFTTYLFYQCSFKVKFKDTKMCQSSEWNIENFMSMDIVFTFSNKKTSVELIFTFMDKLNSLKLTYHVHVSIR